MSEELLRSLRQALIEAGVAARIAARTEIELRDHLIDLEAEARQCGRDVETAAAEARQRLGSVEVLAAAVLARPELRSWAFRCPIVRPVVRVFAIVGLACYRGVHGALARSAARFAIASISASLATTLLLYLLAYSVLPARHRGWIGTSPAAVAARVDGVSQRAAAARRAAASGEPVSALMPGSAPGAARESRGAGLIRLTLRPPARDANASEQSQVAIRLSEEARAAARVAAANVRLTAGGLTSGRVRPELAPAGSTRIAATILPPVSERALAARFALPDGDLLPIVKVSPIYPAMAAARGIEGYVVVEYTVTRAGTVRDLVVIESSHPVFERSALDAAAKFRYKPRVISGETVAVSGVRTVLRFKLAA